MARRDREAKGVVIMPCSREMRQRRRASSRSDRWRIFETMGEVVEAMVGAMKSSWRSEGASMPAQWYRVGFWRLLLFNVVVNSWIVADWRMVTA